MSLSEQPSTLSSRLGALAQRLGLIGRGQRQILERAPLRYQVEEHSARLDRLERTRPI